MTSRPANSNPKIGAWRLSTRKGSGRYQTGRDRVAQILDTALEIILESGYQALTLREVARRCKVQIGAISYYYKSRTDLLQDVLNMVLTPYAENLNAIEHAPERPRNRSWSGSFGCFSKTSRRGRRPASSRIYGRSPTTTRSSLRLWTASTYSSGCD